MSSYPSKYWKRQHRADNLLLDYFDEWTCRKGRRYFEEGRVTSLEDKKHGFIATVRGSRTTPYKVNVTLADNDSRILQTSCSCPMYGDCKHAAAATFEYTINNLSTTSSPSSAPQETRLSKAVENTLKTLVEKMSPPPTESGQDTGNSKTKLLYLLQESSWNKEPGISGLVCSLRKDGSIGTIKPCRTDQMFSRGGSALDREISYDLHRLVALNYTHLPSAGLYDTVLKKIVRTGRCHWESAENPALSLGEALPAQFRWLHSSKGNQLSLVAICGESMFPCMRWADPWYLDRTNWRIGPIVTEFDREVFTVAWNLPPLNDAESTQAAQLLQRLGAPSTVPLPDASAPLQIRVVEPLPSLRLERRKAKAYIYREDDEPIKPGSMTSVAVVTVDYPKDDPAETIKEDWTYNQTKQCQERMLVTADGATVLERRKLSDQYSKLDILYDIGFDSLEEDSVSGQGRGAQYFAPQRAGCVAEFLTKHKKRLEEQGWNISVDEKLLPIDVQEDQLSLEAGEDDDQNEDTGENWWLSLSLGINVDGKKVEILPVIMQALSSLELDSESTNGDALAPLNQGGKFYVELSDARLISLPFEKVRPLFTMLFQLLNRDRAATTKVSVVQLAALSDDLAWRGSKRLRQLVDRLKNFLMPGDPATVPAGFLTQLRPYQIDGLTWLQKLARYNFGGILADDMGLGKTVQLLAHVLLEKSKGRSKTPFLVVCPTSVLPNWVAEAERFAPDLKVVAFHGADRFLKIPEFSEADLVVSTYPIVLREEEALKAVSWHGIVLDEAQAIKNCATRIAQIIYSLPAQHKICLTGTPVQNNLGDLWSQFRFLMPGLLGEETAFKRNFRTPIEKKGDQEKKQLLAGRIRPFLVRRTKAEVALELPDKTVITSPCQLEGAQRDLYETVRVMSLKKVRDEIARRGFEKSQIVILEALLRLRQVCCDPRLVKIPAAEKVRDSAKLQLLMEMLQQLADEGRKVLLFSQFTSMLDLIAPELDKRSIDYVELRGDTKDRKAPIERFQKSDTPVFLISLKAGGTGLNLTAADTVIHYDPWWNPAVEDQATDRAYRIGQTKNVFVYKLIAQGTIEQRMVELQERKRQIADSIYSGNGTSAKLTEADLEVLFRPIG